MDSAALDFKKQYEKLKLGYKTAVCVWLLGMGVGIVGASMYQEKAMVRELGSTSTVTSATTAAPTSSRTEQWGGVFERQALVTLFAVGFGYWLAPKQSEGKGAEERLGPVQTAPQEASTEEGGENLDPAAWPVGGVPVPAVPATPLPVPEEGLVWRTNANFRNGAGKFHRVMSCGPLREAPSGIAAALRSELEGRGLTSCLLCF